ncbi:MAG: pilus assembly protein TadG-related protein [Anaerolineae bacterium]
MRDKERKQFQNQRGQVLVWVVILLPLLIALTGLVFDGGLLWAQYRRARWAADGAAVAAASDIDRALYRDLGQVKLTEQALYTAMYYASENDPDLRISTIYVLDNVIYVQGRVDVEPIFLGLFGVDGLTLDVRGRERPAWGITQEGE